MCEKEVIMKELGYEDAAFSTQVQQRPVRVLPAFAVIFLDLAGYWCVRQRGESEGMSAIAGRIVECLRVLCHTLVPNHDCAGLVADSAAKVVAAVDVVEQEFENAICDIIVSKNSFLHDLIRSVKMTYRSHHHPSRLCSLCKRN